MAKSAAVAPTPDRSDTPAVPNWLLIVLGLTSSLLLYIPGVGLPPVVAFVAAVTIVAGARGTGRVLWPAVFALALAIGSAVALTYSPNLNSALTSTLFYAELAGLLVVGYRVGAWSQGLRYLITVWTVAATVDAVLVVYFRLQPNAEISWFQSGVARLVIAGGTLNTLFTTNPDNALAPDKAGAFFVNADSGSAFLGVAFIIALYLFRRSGRRRWLMLAALFAGAIVASGSKTGIALLVLIPALLLLARVRAAGLRAMLIPFFFLVVGAAIYAAGSILSNSEDVISRETLWGLAAQAITLHPWDGLGYGGFENYAQGYFGLIGSSTTYLPQNLALYTGVELGVPGLLCFIGFYASVFWGLVRSDLPSHGVVAAAVAWTFLSAMGDNTSVFNDFHAMPLLAIVVGAYLARPSREMTDPWSQPVQRLRTNATAVRGGTTPTVA